MQRLDNVILDLIQSSVSNFRVAPLNLGSLPGSGGGIGGPPGGFIGYLAQTRVAYDLDEFATMDTPGSGQSLLDNLNHIRARIGVLESGGTLVVVDDNTSTSYTDVSSVHFIGSGVIVTDLGGGDVQIEIDATGTGTGSGQYQQYVYTAGVRSDHPITQSFTAQGVIDTCSGAMGTYIVVSSGILDSVYMYIENMGTAGLTIVDVNLNGTTVFTDQDLRPTLYFDGVSHKFEAFPTISGLEKGDIITFDFDTVASGASNLTIAPVITPLIPYGFVTDDAGEPITVLLNLE